jgi:hypothetical protein
MTLHDGAHAREMLNHDKRYPICIITFGAASTGHAFMAPFFAAPVRSNPALSGVRVFVVDDPSTKRGEEKG